MIKFMASLMTLFVVLLGVHYSHGTVSVVCGNYTSAEIEEGWASVTIPSDGGCNLPNGYVTLKRTLYTSDHDPIKVWTESYDASGKLISEKFREYPVNGYGPSSNLTLVLPYNAAIAILTITQLPREDSWPGPPHTVIMHLQ